MSETTVLQEDASEMIRILTTAKCIGRHSIISADRLSEILTAIFWPVAVLITYSASWLSYRFIEAPGIAVGKSLIVRLQQPRVALGQGHQW
jgi:peptidoglycan/LPS O-acetylase OafA/YrhL